MLTFKKTPSGGRTHIENVTEWALFKCQHTFSIYGHLVKKWRSKFFFYRRSVYKTMVEFLSARLVSSRDMARCLGVTKQMDLGIYLFVTGGPRGDRTGRHKFNQSSQMCQGSLFLPHSYDLTVSSHTLKKNHWLNEKIPLSWCLIKHSWWTCIKLGLSPFIQWFFFIESAPSIYKFNEDFNHELLIFNHDVLSLYEVNSNHHTMHGVRNGINDVGTLL